MDLVQKLDFNDRTYIKAIAAARRQIRRHSFEEIYELPEAMAIDVRIGEFLVDVEINVLDKDPGSVHVCYSAGGREGSLVTPWSFDEIFYAK